MVFDYFYGEQAESYSFYRMPRILFTGEKFCELSTDAKILYGILLDRVSLSAKNGWIDDRNRVFVYMTVSSIEEALGRCHQKACGLLAELEEFGLIERHNQGQGKPSRIYVKNFIQVWNSDFKKYEKHTSGSMKNELQEVCGSYTNNTYKNNTKASYTHSIHSEGSEEREKYIAYFSDRLQIDWLKETNPYDQDIIKEIFDLIIDTVCSGKEKILISGEKKPADIVKSQFMKLDCTHIQFVLNGLKENTTKIKCIKRYLLATLYNAPLTINNYYQSLVQHDMSRRDVLTEEEDE